MTNAKDGMKLVSPLKRVGGDEVTHVAVRKPDVGALRGLKLSNVLQMDVNAMVVLLPRITTPSLLPDEVAALDPADLLSLSAKVIGFFMTADQVAEAEAEARLN